ncbi:POL, partial [Symbiodinium sp. CCMP2592]
RRGATATLILNQNGGQEEEAQPPRLSSTRIGARGCSRHAYPGARRRGAAAALILNQNGGQGGRGAAATLILNQNRGQGAKRCSRHAYPQPEWGPGGRGAAATLILNQNRGQGAKGAAATLILNQNGGQGEEAQPPRLSSTRIGARGYSRHAYPVPGEEVQPPRLSSTRMGAGGRGAAATLILNQNRGQGVQPPRLSGARRRGAAATLILNQNGGQGGRGAAATLILNQNRGQGAQPPRLFGARRRSAAATLILNQNGGQGDEAQRRGAAATLILNQNGGQGEEAQPRRGAAATLILNQNGGQGDEAQPRRGAAATLILNQNGGQGEEAHQRGQGEEAQPRRGAAATLILNQNGGQGEEAQPRKGAAARLILNQNGGQGDEAQPRRGAAATLILNQNGGEEVQPPRLSSTRMGAKGKRRRGAAATLILNQNCEEVQPPRLSSTRMGARGKRRRGAAATRILNQNGGQGEEAQPRRGAAATLILNQNGGQGEEAQPRRGAAATLILNQNGGQGEEAQPRRGAAATLILHQNGGEEVQPPRRGREGLSSTNMGFRGVEARAEEDGGKDEVWKLKLKKTEVWKLKPKKTEVWKLKLKKTEARTRCSKPESAAVEGGEGEDVRILNPKRDGDGDEAGELACRSGNLVRQLKQWRRNGSPTYEAAFGMGSLCVLSTSEQYGLRAKAGQPPKFKPSWSWLHKKSPRLKHFLLGRPILRANPSMSSSSRQYVKAASSPRSGIGSWRLLSAYVGCRKAAQRIAAATKKDARGSFWQGKKAMLRVYRRRWWLARRRLKRRYSALMVRTEKPFLSYKAAKWAIEENILQAGFRVQISRQNHPQWKFLTETGSLLFFQSLNESLGLAQKQLATATCSVNNALGRQACDITLQGAQDLLKARGYEHDWCTFLRQGGRILSPLVVDCALEKSGFKLQHCQNLEVWPAGAQSILQIRGDRNSCHERWVALISCHSRIYLLDCFQDEPEPTVNCQLGVQPCDTYAVIRL